MTEERGKTSREVCDLLKIPYGRLMSILHARRGGFPVEIRKERGALVWDRRAVAALRRILEEMDGKREGRETAEARRYREAVLGLGKVARELERLASGLRRIHKGLKANAPTALVKIHTLSGEGLRLLVPVGVVVSPAGRAAWKAELPEARLETRPQQTREKAVRMLREMLVAEYHRLSSNPEQDPSRWQVLDRIILRE